MLKIDVCLCRLAEQDAAATSGREAEEDLGKAAARSPYQAPGGRWSKFRSYSVWQACASSPYMHYNIVVYEPEDGMQLRSNAGMVSNILMAGFCAEDVHDLGLRLQIFLQTLARGAQIHIWKTGEN